jgi:hypothetical protein
VQIAFLTLFLGLISGPQPVAVSAGPGVAAVELELDGASGGRLGGTGGAPWRGEIDFGRDLLPHHLVARALDRDGAEVAQADQWINLPRAAAEVEIVLEKAAAGRPRSVRLAWQSLTNEPPRAVTLTLDGRPLALDGHGRAQLPALPEDGATRVLSAEVRFGSGAVARRDVALGRRFDDEVSSELTAVPVAPRGRGELPPADQLQGWFTAGGRELRVEGIEAGGARLVAVRDAGATAALARSSVYKRNDERSLAAPPATVLSFIWPAAHGYAAAPGSGVPSELFDSSQDFTDFPRGLPWLLARVEHAGAPVAVATPGSVRIGDIGEHRLADAVAVAGLQAAAGGRPRAVLLLLPQVPLTVVHDASRYSGAAVRRYLAAMHVPLAVWSEGPPAPEARAAWGDSILDVSTRAGLGRAMQALRDTLAEQRIVLVSGRLLPQAITLSPTAAARVELVPRP